MGSRPELQSHLPAAMSSTLKPPGASPYIALPSACHHRVMNVHTTCISVFCHLHRESFSLLAPSPTFLMPGKNGLRYVADTLR